MDTELHTTYKITIHTGSTGQAGTNNTVHIQIHGEKGKTDYHELDQFFENDMEKGDIKLYKVKDLHVGAVSHITLKLTKSFLQWEDDWFVNMVKITAGGMDQIVVPMYTWLSHVKKEATGNAHVTTIPNKDPFSVCYNGSETNIDTAHRPKVLPLTWRYLPGFPGMCQVSDYEELDRNLKFLDERQGDFNASFVDAVKQAIVDIFMECVGKSFEDLDDFKGVYHKLEDYYDTPWYDDGNTWQTDKEFGRQTINGLNPGKIKRCKEIPKNFKVTDAAIAGLLPSGSTLVEEAEKGNIYIIDYAVLEGIDVGTLDMKADGKKLEMAVPMCLFYASEEGELLPIAIQLKQDTETVWTPNDNTWDWLLAKMWFRNADISVHQIQTHLNYTHMLVGVFAVATNKNLPAVHPVYKLLRQHLHYVIAINSRGLTTLVNENGLIDQNLPIGHGSTGYLKFMTRTAEEWDFSKDWDFPADIARRDVADLPNYHYRDDALAIWNEIKTYVQNVINIYYKSDADLKGDSELKAWVNDIYENGLKIKKEDGTLESLVNCNFPSTIETRGFLVSAITRIIFTTSVQHAAVNFLQFSYLKYAPAYPATMRGKVPVECDRGNITRQMVLDSLPDQKMATTQMLVAYILSQYADTEVYLTNVPPQYFFMEIQAQLELEKFRARMLEVDLDISKRNDAMKKEGKPVYEVLRPTKVPYGIAI